LHHKSPPPLPPPTPPHPITQVPFFFKHAVDALALDPTGVAPSALWGAINLGPVALLMGYGVSRAGAAFCGEMRNIVFAKVGGAGCVVLGGCWGFRPHVLLCCCL